MRRRALLLLLAGYGCRGAAAPEGLDFAKKLVAIAEREEPLGATRLAWTFQELARLTESARLELEREPRRPFSATLGRLIFERWGFVREVKETSVDLVLLPTVIEKRRGNCVGLGTLFLALADALGREAHGVLAPGHFYVKCVEASGARNVELLRSGESMPDSWYAARFPIPGGSAPQYARPLTPREVLGVVEYDVGAELRRKGSLPRAREALKRAVEAFPELSEALASLGAVHHLLGDLDAAAESYARARTVNPHLPGVTRNEALLAAERRGLSAEPRDFE
jgi:tetratricopeptide (TPR) repeat protein